jgi:hypothetical protein
LSNSTSTVTQLCTGLEREREIKRERDKEKEREREREWKEGRKKTKCVF